MRNRAVVGVATFYLLLSTGMFACLVSCGSKSLIDVFTFEHKHGAHEHDGHSKECTGTADCPCCNNHGNYVVKENIKPATDASVPQLPLITYLDNELGPQFIFGQTVISEQWFQTHAPPPKTANPIFIVHHSLLI